MTSNLTWALVDRVASDLGANKEARLKWRQPNRGVPSAWRIRIVQHLMGEGTPVSLSDFDQLEPLPGRIAA